MAKSVVICFTVASLLVFSSAAEVTIQKNIPYLKDANYADDKDKLDLYIPEGVDLPIMIFIHGGGLLAGDKGMYGFVGKHFASEGFLTVVVNHRLSPGVGHPAHIEDIAASFAWVYKNIEKYGGDADRIFVTGHSAGAYLAGLLALDARYLNRHGLSPANILGVVPISGFYHVERLAPGRPKTVWGEDPAAWPLASPARYASGTAPPMLLLYADGDVPERRKESEDLASALRAKGHDRVRTRQISDRDHTSIVRKLGSQDAATAAAMVAFMQSLLKTL